MKEKYIFFVFDKYELGIEFKKDMHLIDFIDIFIKFCEENNISCVRDGVLKNVKIIEKECI